MPMSRTLEQFLESRHISYEVLHHPPTSGAMYSAAEAHVPGDRLAKSVVLHDAMGYVIAVVPSTRRVDLGRLGRQLHRHLGLADEVDLAQLFGDCEPGAVPPVGSAFGLATVIDDSLSDQPDVFFEAGDHEGLVHVSRTQFGSLMTGAERGRFSYHV